MLAYNCWSESIFPFFSHQLLERKKTSYRTSPISCPLPLSSKESQRMEAWWWSHSLALRSGIRCLWWAWYVSLVTCRLYTSRALVPGYCAEGHCPWLRTAGDGPAGCFFAAWRQSQLTRYWLGWDLMRSTTRWVPLPSWKCGPSSSLGSRKQTGSWASGDGGCGTSSWAVGSAVPG